MEVQLRARSHDRLTVSDYLRHPTDVIEPSDDRASFRPRVGQVIEGARPLMTHCLAPHRTELDRQGSAGIESRYGAPVSPLGVSWTTAPSAQRAVRAGQPPRRRWRIRAARGCWPPNALRRSQVTVTTNRGSPCEGTRTSSAVRPLGSVENARVSITSPTAHRRRSPVTSVPLSDSMVPSGKRFPLRAE